MSADRLRVAATLLRERAEAATPGPWSRDASYAGNGDLLTENIVKSQWDVATCAGADVAPEDGRHLQARADADYFAMMDPTVALAVADWLIAVAQRGDEIGSAIRSIAESVVADHVPGWRQALAAADAILAGGAS